MKALNPTTTSQSFAAPLKSGRSIMRKDKGLNGDLARLPMLTWIMSLKFVDDLELQREQLGNKKFKVAINTPYGWPDWAAPTTSPEPNSSKLSHNQQFA